MDILGKANDNRILCLIGPVKLFGANNMNSVRSYFHFFLITFVLVGCQSADIESTVVVENFDLDELFYADSIVNYREVKRDADAFLDVIISHHYVLYEDLEKTFSIVFAGVPLETDLEWTEYSISREVMLRGSLPLAEEGIIAQRVAYFKADPPIDYTEEFQAELADRIIPNFEPAHHRFPFKTNGVEGLEFWYFIPIEEGSEVGAHARVRTIVHGDYIYVLRITGFNEEMISGIEVDKFFASFELK